MNSTSTSIGLLCLLTVGSAKAQSHPHGTYLTAPYGPGGTWNLYMTHSIPMTWADAQTAAAQAVDPLGGSGKKGHLVTVGSAAENMFVYETVEGRYIWIGLTDNEKWGGREAGSDRKGGWRWVTGEPLDFGPWRGPEPDNRTVTGEDAVAMESGGRWADWPIGVQGQEQARHASMFEWDIRSPKPVPGALIVGPVLPKEWSLDLSTWKGEVSGKGPWTVFSVPYADGRSLGTVSSDLQLRLKTATSCTRMPRLNYHFKVGDPFAGGWIGIQDLAPFPLIDGGCGALHVAKIRLEKPATWSFNVHGDDYFAVRLRGLRWKTSAGLGGVDPLDPSVIYSSTSSGDGCVIGSIDLPAGDSTIEVFLGNRHSDCMIQLLAAPGEILAEGGTERWRHPGHKAAGDLAWPGVDAAGWKVFRMDRDAGSPPITKLMDALALADSADGKTVESVEKINYIDSGSAGDIEFPNPSDFPGDRPGGQDQFVVRATATLVIPRDGVYHIGIHADDHVALRIFGGSWKSMVRDTGYVGRIEGDTIYGEAPDPNGTNAQFLGEITLKKGNYPIEALYTNIVGASVLSVFGGPAFQAPRLILKGGAGIEPDIDGLPLTQISN